MLAATQATVTKLSDFLVFQQPGVIYGIVIAMIAAGAMFWLFGFQFHRLVLTLFFLGTGIWIGWYIGPMYGINSLLSMFIGGLLGAGIGYWFFNFWLAIFSSALIFLVLLSLYSWHIAYPYLKNAGQQSQKAMEIEGLKLAPGPSSSLTTNRSGVEVEDTKISDGRAFQELKLLVPKLSRAQYPDWQSWQEEFGPTLWAVWDRLKMIIPRLSVNMMLLAGVALIFGCVLALLRPAFLNIVYTSLFGALLIFGGMSILMTLRNTNHLAWLEGRYWLISVFLVILWIAGAGVQYWLKPAPPAGEEEGEDEEESDEPNKPKGEKKKK
ncbi:MAG: hypothetical protein GX629_01360 [Phycisphaerae bacterium]|nr:hypothetical protein [Phycisphaerae bacterium]